MSPKPLAIVVVGHTNAGKTSLLRTLTRDKHFGEVSHRNATTRHVEQTQVVIAGHAVLRLFDTPGFEDSVQFRHYLRQFDTGRGRKAILDAFLESPEASGRFEQQAKVVRILATQIDAICYVIDSTETPLPKYIDELDVLSMCALPVLPVLNFVRDPASKVEAWTAILADRGLHAKVSFDAVAPLLGSERLLYARLGSLLGGHEAQLLAIADALEQEAVQRNAAANQVIAELLVDVTAYRIQAPEKEPVAIAAANQTIRRLVKDAEQKSVDALLALYRFDRSDFRDDDIPVIESGVEHDLFNPEGIKAASLRLGLGAVIGTAIGLGVDIAMVGMTFGAGVVVGSALGGMLASSAKDMWRWANARYHGYIDLMINEATLAVLVIRQLQLLQAIEARTHAAQEAAERGGEIELDAFWSEMPSALNKARIHPKWSRIGDRFVPDADREEVIADIAAVLAQVSCLSGGT